MRVDAFDFDLPGESIALRPASPRDSARLLVVDPAAGSWSDRHIGDLPQLLTPRDLLVFNDTKVIPARLRGRRIRKGEAGPSIEATLHKRVDGNRWRALVRPARKLLEGDRITFSPAGNVCFADELAAEVEVRGAEGEILLRFDFSGAVLDEAIAAHGEMPLPPYIASKRAPDARDRDDYQTLLARVEGAVAAPTAGLHFTENLLERLAAAGIDQVCVTLHVGAGTFLPVKSETTEGHRMHSEWGEVTPETARRISEARAAGGRIVCVGTTALRLIETAASATGEVVAFTGETDIFITPGYRFRAADMLLTNFHLPRSTLFMLVCAFSGFDLMKQAYAHAVSSGYRFYSYGDACLLSRAPG